ncbi:hypothetical protein [Aneurinibacillus tyrosinisolvens]|jgi:bifunctional DNA-binding transcriptional regulator/antitoxin component of YhaV-PrlF toxin-antitoxin module|uniref:hypothetical protein n=1 Tax=Aneurinibacillus tyrosinisolvens TaxID=1443435 RepID=UPI00063F748A|nr:hypothetical protein [Aneurinibacillus tyrosinisolvens]
MEKKPIVCQLDERGNLVLPEEIKEVLGHGTIEVTVREGAVVLKKAEPAYTFMWDTSHKEKE